MEFTLQATFGIIFLQKILHKSILCEENPPRLTYFSNFHPQYQLAGPFSWFSADRLPAGWCSAGCLSPFWLPKVVYQVPSAYPPGLLASALFPHRFLEGFLMIFGSIFGHFFNDFSMFFASLFRGIFFTIFLFFSNWILSRANPKIIEISLVLIGYSALGTFRKW